jgi:putative cell wall-binding protein
MIAGLAGALLLAACASSPPAPEVAMSAARQAIAVADQAQIAPAASPALAEAHSKLAAADTAVRDQHMIQAERLAQESRVDAELALAQSNAAKDQAVNDEMLRSTDTLSEELKRNAGATP